MYGALLSVPRVNNDGSIGHYLCPSTLVQVQVHTTTLFGAKRFVISRMSRVDAICDTFGQWTNHSNTNMTKREDELTTRAWQQKTSLLVYKALKGWQTLFRDGCTVLKIAIEIFGKAPTYKFRIIDSQIYMLPTSVTVQILYKIASSVSGQCLAVRS